MPSHIREQIDLLTSLRLPDRYEPLTNLLGNGVANILVAPKVETAQQVQATVDQIRASGQGTILPLYGDSGAGKTTFASSVGQWFAKDFTSTIAFDGDISRDALTEAVREFRRDLAANDERIIPIVIDHRESDPPSAEELARIKSFLRTSPGGAKNLIFWPETKRTIAEAIAKDYKSIAGAQPHEYIEVHGPDRVTWGEIAKSTLRLANGVDSLEKIGVDPSTYDVDQFPSLGEYLRRIQADFNKQLAELRASVAKAILLIIVFASESGDPGVLSFLTSSSRYGLLDASGLLDATPESTIGKWWANRQGLLVRAIVQLNAHALALGPAISVSALRNFGDSADPFFDKVGYARMGPAKSVQDLARSDIAKLLLGERLARYEGRGNPAHSAIAVFKKLAEKGFNLGADKNLNRLMSEGWRAFLDYRGQSYKSVNAEKKLELGAIIPDNSIEYDDTIVCIEYTRRKGEFLSSGNRSTVAQYILTKLKNYVLDLGWAVE